MANALLDRAPPAEFAARRQAFEISAKISDFPRLTEIVERDLASLDDAQDAERWRDRPVDIRLRFGWADVTERLPALSGSVGTVVTAVCQRCLEPFDFPLTVDLDLLLVEGESHSDGSDGREVWELEGDTIRPRDVVEEALVMALPLAAMHEAAEQCEALPSDTIEETAADTARPFANLRAQMKDEGA